MEKKKSAVAATTGATATATGIDPRSGFCSASRTFHSLRPHVALPPETEPISITTFSLSLLSSLSLPTHHALFVDASTDTALPLGQFLSQLRRLTAALRSPPFSVSRGQVAFILSPNRLEVPLLYFALLSLGAVVCPSNPACTKRDIARQFQLTSPSIAFATSATASLLPTIPLLLLLDSPDFHRMLHANDHEPEAAAAAEEIRQDDTAIILFSSGTTGTSKAVAASHRNYIAMIAGYDEEMRRRRIGGYAEKEVMLLTAPMFHSLGCLKAIKGVAIGDTTVILRRRSPPPPPSTTSFADMMHAARRYRATSITAAPPLMLSMSRGGVEHHLRSLWRVVCGGAPLRAPVIELLKKILPWVDVEMGYGLTEGGGVARMINSEECNNFKSVGKLNENVVVKIVDPTSGESLQVGHSGELWLAGPVIMKGYVGDDMANAIAFTSQGWLKTGDIGYIDEDGYLYLVDRLKELIKYKAYQVSPAELEQLLHTFPEIDDAAVVPYPNEEAGEVPMAFIVKRPGNGITESQIIDIISKQVAPYKRIRKVSFVDSIPRNPSGKILRKELVSRAITCFNSRL